jgi:phosphohistidine phosphatase
VLTLYLIRHAKSSWDNPALRDFQRPLNERGLETAPQMAALMKKEGIIPDLLVSSPAKRALDTARFFAAQYGVSDEAIVQEKDIYEASPIDLMRVISHLPDSAPTIFLFGHNPGLTDLVNQFTDDFIDNIPTCGIVRIVADTAHWNSFYEGNASLNQVWFPKRVLL